MDDKFIVGRLLGYFTTVVVLLIVWWASSTFSLKFLTVGFCIVLIEFFIFVINYIRIKDEPIAGFGSNFETFLGVNLVFTLFGTIVLSPLVH